MVGDYAGFYELYDGSKSGRRNHRSLPLLPQTRGKTRKHGPGSCIRSAWLRWTVAYNSQKRHAQALRLRCRHVQFGSSVNVSPSPSQKPDRENTSSKLRTKIKVAAPWTRLRIAQGECSRKILLFHTVDSVEAGTPSPLPQAARRSFCEQIAWTPANHWYLSSVIILVTKGADADRRAVITSWGNAPTGPLPSVFLCCALRALANAEFSIEAHLRHTIYRGFQEESLPTVALRYERTPPPIRAKSRSHLSRSGASASPGARLAED